MNSINPTRKTAIIEYLKAYIDISKKYNMYVAGIIGAETALFNDNLEKRGDFFLMALRANVNEIVYGLYNDSGDYTADMSDMNEIWDAVKILL